jgi:hypothetical protein
LAKSRPEAEKEEAAVAEEEEVGRIREVERRLVHAWWKRTSKGRRTIARREGSKEKEVGSQSVEWIEKQNDREGKEGKEERKEGRKERKSRTSFIVALANRTLPDPTSLALANSP